MILLSRVSAFPLLSNLSITICVYGSPDAIIELQVGRKPKIKKPTIHEELINHKPMAAWPGAKRAKRVQKEYILHFQGSPAR